MIVQISIICKNSMFSRMGCESSNLHVHIEPAKYALKGAMRVFDIVPLEKVVDLPPVLVNKPNKIEELVNQKAMYEPQRLNCLYK